MPGSDLTRFQFVGDLVGVGWLQEFVNDDMRKGFCGGVRTVEVLGVNGSG